MPSTFLYLQSSGLRTDVSVRAEHVVGVVGLLDLDEAVEVDAVRVPDALLALVRGLEVDVRAAGREGPQLRPRVTDPLPERVHACLVPRPHALHAEHVAGVSVPDSPVVLVVLVERSAEVQEADVASGMGHSAKRSRVVDRRSSLNSARYSVFQ